jgi:hypothetical protein
VVNRLTLYPAPITSSKRSASASSGSPVNTRCSTSNAGTTSRTSRVTTPSRPSATTAPAKRPSERSSTTTSPSGPTISTAATGDARHPLASPDPWVPVATDPATEMCGSDPRLGSAHPRSCSARPSSA